MLLPRPHRARPGGAMILHYKAPACHTQPPPPGLPRWSDDSALCRNRGKLAIDLAYVQNMSEVFRYSYFVGTFGEYDLGVIPKPRS